MSDLISAATVATKLNVSTRTLMRWRDKGSGPPYIQFEKLGTVRYPLSALEVWITERTSSV